VLASRISFHLSRIYHDISWTYLLDMFSIYSGLVYVFWILRGEDHCAISFHLSWRYISRKDGGLAVWRRAMRRA
jgi:hypothetical protein